jgi:hypothetical protein
LSHTSKECASPAAKAPHSGHDPRRDPGQRHLSAAGRAQAWTTVSKRRVEGHREAVVADLPAQPLGDVELGKNSTIRSRGDHHFSGPTWAKGYTPRA